MYIVRQHLKYCDLTGLAVSPERMPGGWARAQWAMIDRYPWDESDYRPQARAALAEWQGGLCGLMMAREETISGTVTEVGGGVCVDSCLECFVQPFADDARYLNVEINCVGTAHIGLGEGRHGRRVWHALPEGARVSASAHRDGWWAVSFFLPASFLAECFGGRALAAGAPMRGNFYKCDETIHPHFGAWHPVAAPQPDFHRPECFGDMRIERRCGRRHIARDEFSSFHRRTYARARTSFRGVPAEIQLMRIGGADRPFAVPDGKGGRLVIADAGYCWLQIAPEGGNWWLTAMYDPQGHPLQYYFDATDGNALSGGRDAWFDDLYLDVVLHADGSVETLDRGELDAALAAGAITAAQRDAALAAETDVRRMLADGGRADIDRAFSEMAKLPLARWEAL